MIIPTAQYDPMFADDGVPFRTKMIQYIRQEFSDLIGPRVGLLETSDGLERLSASFSQTTTLGADTIRKAA